MPSSVETYSEDGRWKNRIQGNSRASNTFDTKAEAQAKKKAIISRKRAVTKRLTKPIVVLAIIRNIYSL